MTVVTTNEGTATQLDPSDHVQRAEAFGILETCMAQQLSADEQYCLYAVVAAGATLAEVAETLKCTPQTIANIRKRAIKKLNRPTVRAQLGEAAKTFGIKF